MYKLKNEESLVIHKPDKGITIVILDKDSYLKPLETLLKLSSKFTKIQVVTDKGPNFVFISAKRVNDLVKNL